MSSDEYKLYSDSNSQTHSLFDPPVRRVVFKPTHTHFIYVWPDRGSSIHWTTQRVSLMTLSSVWAHVSAQGMCERERVWTNMSLFTFYVPRLYHVFKCTQCTPIPVNMFLVRIWHESVSCFSSINQNVPAIHVVLNISGCMQKRIIFLTTTFFFSLWESWLKTVSKYLEAQKKNGQPWLGWTDRKVDRQEGRTESQISVMWAAAWAGRTEYYFPQPPIPAPQDGVWDFAVCLLCVIQCAVAITGRCLLITFLLRVLDSVFLDYKILSIFYFRDSVRS